MYAAYNNSSGSVLEILDVGEYRNGRENLSVLRVIHTQGPTGFDLVQFHSFRGQPQLDIWEKTMLSLND